MANESFHTVFVAKTATLLADGATVEAITEGQVGVLDAKTYLGETTPTYANQKAIKLVWGTPNLGTTPLLSGTPNENEYTQLIKGKKIKSFVGIASKTGQNQIIAVGYTGAGGNTDTLVAKIGEVKHLFVTLTGGPIDKKFSLQGVTRHYEAVVGCKDECSSADACDKVDPRLLAAEFAKLINADANINRFVTATVLTNDAVTAWTQGAAIYAGVKLELSYTRYVANECTYDHWNYDADAVFITASEFDQNYHNYECSTTPFKVTQLQAFKQPIGFGPQVRKVEKLSKGYALRNRSFDPVVREIEGYTFVADATKYYDEYILEFDFEYKTGGWSEKYVDTHKVHVFFEEGTGGNFETAINGYIATIGLELDPVTL